MSFKDEFKSFAQKLGFKVTESEESESQNSVLGLEDPKPAQQLPLSPAAEKPATATAEQIAGFKSAANDFAVAEIKAGKMSPREKDDFVENYAQAAFDDSVSPLASGSRAERLKAQSANRKSSLLTEETVNAENNQVLLAGGDNSNADERRQKLLGATQLGKRTLELQKK